MHYFLSRHAILDKQQKVYAYELLFSENLETNQNKQLKSDQKASKVLLDSFYLMGIETITGGRRALVKFTKNLLTSDFAHLFSHDIITVKIGNEIIYDAKIAAACENLKKSGYMIVLDDFTFNQNSVLMLPFCTMVSVDTQSVGDYILKVIATRLKSKNIKCLAKNIINQNTFNKVRELEYDYFSGPFIGKTTTIEKRDVPVQKISFLEMLKEVTKADVNFSRIENIVKRDVSLTYKLLKMINSSVFGIKNEVKSIKQALVLLGANEVKRWITLVILSNIGNDKPDELLRISLLRARFLELLAPLAGMEKAASDLFLMGLLSLMSTLMDQPLKSVLHGLPLSDDVKNALLGEESPYKNIFDLVVCHENADWSKIRLLAKDIKIDEKGIQTAYTKAAQWVNQVTF